MERTSQLILRNRERISQETVCLIEPVRDGCSFELLQAGKTVLLQTQDFATWRYHRASGVNIRYGVSHLLDQERGEPEQALTAILYLPREKKRLEMMLHRASVSLPANSEVWLVGENRAGIKSARILLDRYFSRVAKRDTARHCVLYSACQPRNPEPFRLEDYYQTWSLNSPACPMDKQLTIASLPGVFSHGRLDAGTAFLLEHLPDLSRDGSLLDFGCGAGLIGLCLKAQHPALEITLLDSSALAIESARASASLNGLEVCLLPSDGFSEVRGTFDWIVSNPPFHQGVNTSFEAFRGFCSHAGRHLNPNGNIMLVANRHLPYVQWLKMQFRTVEVVAENQSFKIIRAQFAKPLEKQ
jgi:16S rRNA (guanine1207-N2)-methyltransferase